MKNLKTKLALVGTSLLGATQAFAQSATVDYSTLTSAVSFTDIIAVLMGVAAVIVGFILVKNNIGVIMSFLKGKAK